MLKCAKHSYYDTEMQMYGLVLTMPMALTLQSKLILVGCLLVAIFAWLPTNVIKTLVPHHVQETLTELGCPLGYGQHSSEELLDGRPHGHIPLPGVRTRDLVIYFNGTIWTADLDVPYVQALLVDVEYGTILKRGSLVSVSNEAQRVMERESTRRIVSVQEHDLGGSFLLPGFIDPHVHLLSAGLLLSQVDLSAAVSKQDVIQAVRTAASAAASRRESGDDGESRTTSEEVLAGNRDRDVVAPSSDEVNGSVEADKIWILGGGWEEGKWGGALPHKSWLDQGLGYLGALPVFLLRKDLHCGVASSLALQLAGITADTPDPQGGSIDRGSDGHPTGILRDRAIQLVLSLVPEPSVEQRQVALKVAAQYALSRGVTTVGDMGRLSFGDTDQAWKDFEEVHLPWADQGRLPLRINLYMPLRSWSRLATHVAARGYAHPSGRLFWGGVKEFADGSLGSCTALMHEPYLGDECKQGHNIEYSRPNSTAYDKSLESHGLRMVERSNFERMVIDADNHGLQVAVHAIGDKAVDEVAETFRRALAARLEGAATMRFKRHDPAAPSSRPMRLEHAQHISSPEACETLAHPDIMVVPNPLHLLDDAQMVRNRLGDSRATKGRAYAINTMQKAGVTLAFGSDWPVVDLNPLLSIHAAAWRGPYEGDQADILHEQQCHPRQGPHSDEQEDGILGAIAPDKDTRESDKDTRESDKDTRESDKDSRESERTDCNVDHSILKQDWPWIPEEAVDLMEALFGHTRQGAAALMMQDYVGTLREGMRADFVILHDIKRSLPWSDKHKPKVLATVVDGRCVHGSLVTVPWVPKKTKL
ncbi:hypothetical protein CEUSTIGMA_g3075.t1 [Chlamydomonas eustigma]|uniref:Amidohydrolase 3 domain-containing protein n=1 Tax=Chlamydomonas eustigma TaxID=1157962 RepID=A0A250WXT3_9CHLO|nr:hypothetical protein CEUSTIGMA_g3075.t1 [Chlamydomonas eustigma]|eukprot:GAX75631.1 hypothetical protein CEUSTIGMA_g3075.t1 [Chlamydomonas eustigma]